MDLSQSLTINQSPDRRFQALNQSQQLFLDDPQLKIEVNPVIVKKIIRQRLFFKDKIRKKLVMIEMLTNEQYFNNSCNLRDEPRNCRICLTDDNSSEMIVPCCCKGSSQYIHENCLKIWILEKQGIEQVYKKNLKCEVCNTKFQIQTIFTNKLMPNMILSAPKFKKICWSIQLSFSIILLGAITSLVYLIKGSSESIIYAGLTIVLIVFMLIITLTYVSCMEQMKIEVLEKWIFMQYSPTQQRSATKLKSSKACITDRQQQMQNQQEFRSSRLKTKKRSAINVIQVQVNCPPSLS